MASRERVDTAQLIAERRGAQNLTQAELAERAKISLSLLKKIEQRVRTATPEVVRALATALDVDPDQLSDDVPPPSDRVRAVIPDLRRAIDSYDLPDDGPIRPLDELHRAVTRCIERRVASKYNRLARQLPALLPELARAVQQHTGHHRKQAASLLAQAYRAADGIAYKYGYLDLSARLVELMRWAAARTSDELLVAAAAYVRTETFFATGNLDAALRVLEAATSPLRADTSVAEGATLGSLHMRAAVVAGRSGNQTAAREHLHEAQLVARHATLDG
jgi:transcriptional regulator with XRE-family HTH domain